MSYKKYFTDKNFLVAFWSGVLLLGISLVTQFFISGYVTRSASASVTDIILSNTRVYQVGGIFVWGSVVLVFFGAFLCIKNIFNN